VIGGCEESKHVFALQSSLETPVGRLFRTNVDQHIKRNLIIFVTARLVNPAGQPVNQTEEEQETVQPPILPEIPPYRK
jgi:type II secretory pathway component GspD/PulD (secretin)